MRASRSRRPGRPASARKSRVERVKRPAARRPVGLKAAVKTGKGPVGVPQPVLYRFCKPGWAVIVEHQPNQQGTRFVCPFCPYSHRVPGPVRGFRKVRKAQWVKLRRAEE